MATSVDYSAADHESPSCYNFWSLFGCEDEKLKQLLDSQLLAFLQWEK